MSRSNAQFTCPLCGRERPQTEAVHSELIHGAIAERIRRDKADWAPDGSVCRTCADRYRAEYVQEVLQRDRGELTALESEVVRSLREHEIFSHNPDVEFEVQASTGQRIADRVASFGGSWTFILIFGGVLFAWIAVNALPLLRRAFDPYPFILLNLVLSCIAALQAPVIMMSQNRQEAKDRARAEHDYQVNLKAELEIRHLQSMLEQLLWRQWERLLEVQQIQTDLLQEIARQRQKKQD